MRIAHEVRYSLIQFSRSRQSIFLAILFPVMLLLVLGFLFGPASGNPTLYYVDGDRSPESQAFITALASAGTLDLRDGAGTDLAQSLEHREISAYLEITSGFGEGVAAARLPDGTPAAGLTLYYDPSSSYSETISSIVGQAVDQFDMDMAKVSEPVSVSLQDVSATHAGYVDFLLPGILGICIMFSAINETVGLIMRYQATGTLRKLGTTPFATTEWIASRMIAGTIVVLFSVAVSLAMAWLAFGYVPEINALSLLTVLVGSLTFTGIGFILAHLFENMQSANSAIYIVTMPLILVSGTLFPASQLPCMLRFLSIWSPLTYLTDGLRYSLSGNSQLAIMNLLISVFLGVVVLTVGTAIMMGKEGHDI
jgi:ABC-2 type transport system permease protein